MAFSEEIARGSLILDVQINQSQLDAAARRAAESVNATLQRTLNDKFAKAPLDAVKSLNAAFGGLATNLRVGIPNSFQRAAEAATAFGQAGNRAGQAVSALSIGLLGVAAAAVTVGTRFASIAGDFQALEQSTGAIIENSETASTTTEKFVGDLRALAIESGRSSVQLLNTGRQFLALGFSGEKTTEILNTFAKAAALTGATNQQLSLALNGVAQIASKGAVAMEELRRQIAENLPGAVNLARFFEILGTNLGVSTTEARKLQEQGLIKAKDGIDALLETINETVSGVDVFALRAQTLNGQLGILRETFTQIVQTGFGGFIRSLVPVIKDFTDGFKEGTGPFKDIEQTISDLGKSLGDTLVVVLKELIPLIPGLARDFVDLIKVTAPIIADITRLASAIGNILTPVIRVATAAIRLFFNLIGQSASIGLLIGGLVRSLSGGLAILGRFGGAVGGIFRSLGTFGEVLGSVAGKVVIVVTFINELNVLLGTIKQSIEDSIDTLKIWVDTFPGASTAVNFLNNALKSLVGTIKNNTREFLNFFGIDNRPAKNFTTIAAEAEGAAAIIKKEFADIFPLLDDVDKAQKSLTAATKEYRNALLGVKDAQADVSRAIRDAEKANQDAAEGVVDAQENLTEAQKKLNEVITEGGQEELADARERLRDATDRLVDAEERRVDAQQRLEELLKPATQQELQSATDGLTRAEIALQKAIRERDAALKALNETQEQAIDLSGLSLDQLRSTLANARATAAAQRRAGRDVKNVDELKENAILTEIGVRDAILNVEEARKKLSDTENRGKTETEAIRDARKDLERADRGVANALREVARDTAALQEIEAGRSQFSKDLEAARRGVADAEDRLADAQLNVAQTAEDSARRVADARARVVSAEDSVTAALQRQTEAQRQFNEAQGIALGNQTTLLGIKLQQIAANEALIRQSPNLLESAIAGVIANLPALPSSGGPGAPGAIQRQRLIAGINDLLRDPRLPFSEAFRRLGLPGFAEGGLITSPTVARIGEGFHHEMVLPLSKPDRVWQLLSKTLPKYPAAMAAATAATNQQRQLPRVSVSGSGGAASSAQRKANKDLAQAIAAELVAAGIGQAGGDTHVTIPVTTPIPDPRLLAREIDRRIQRRR